MSQSLLLPLFQPHIPTVLHSNQQVLFTLTKSPSAKFTFTVKEDAPPPATNQRSSVTPSGTLIAHSNPFTIGIRYSFPPKVTLKLSPSTVALLIGFEPVFIPFSQTVFPNTFPKLNRCHNSHTSTFYLHQPDWVQS